MNRIEKDSLGEKQLPSDALYGIHSVRARENFPGNSHFPVEWYKAVGITKLACYNTYRKFRTASEVRFGKDLPFKLINDNILNALSAAAKEVSSGNNFDQFIIPAVQGGAGTSINMNINEIITNSALLNVGQMCGDYSIIDPLEDANIYQSTNDVIPTALTVAVMKLLQSLEEKINLLRQKIEVFEKNNREKLRPGYTQMQAAVPLPSEFFSALIMKHFPATGGGCQNALKGLNRLILVVALSVQDYHCRAFSLWKLYQNSGNSPDSLLHTVKIFLMLPPIWTGGLKYMQL